MFTMLLLLDFKTKFVRLKLRFAATYAINEKSLLFILKHMLISLFSLYLIISTIIHKYFQYYIIYIYILFKV